MSSCHVVSHLHDRILWVFDGGRNVSDVICCALLSILSYAKHYMTTNIYPQATTLRQIRESQALDEKELQEAVNQLK
ncbi:MAG: hypothetical protein WBZ20_10245 [Nitrososphaeraceae archaeon]